MVVYGTSTYNIPTTKHNGIIIYYLYWLSRKKSNISIKNQKKKIKGMYVRTALHTHDIFMDYYVVWWKIRKSCMIRWICEYNDNMDIHLYQWMPKSTGFGLSKRMVDRDRIHEVPLKQTKGDYWCIILFYIFHIILYSTITKRKRDNDDFHNWIGSAVWNCFSKHGILFVWILSSIYYSFIFYGFHWLCLYSLVMVIWITKCGFIFVCFFMHIFIFQKGK